jgi:O-antigen/teichoic acid export membrane protein
MSSIRRQSIISSVIVYFGFALGFFNTYLFTREGGFTKEQFGLTGLFIAFANIMFSVASLGMPAYIGKFFPYYSANLPEKKNDQLAWSLLIPTLGFVIVMAAGLVFKDIVVDRVFNNSPQLLQYYYWTFPFGYGYTIFLVLEAYAWQYRKAVISNLLKEVVFRLMVTVLIVLVTVSVIKDFTVFVIFYSFTYLLLVGMMLVYLHRRGRLHFHFSVSKVTRRLRTQILRMISYIWGGSLVYHVSNVFDTIVIAAVLPNGLVPAAIFTLAQNISSLVYAPQRAVVSAALGPLSAAWREKNLAKINTIYHRSAINQLIFSSAMFCLIWLNFDDGITTFHLQEGYQDAKYIFFFIGLTKVIDMGTGLNSQILSTSNYWKFELITGLILLALALPLNYTLTREMGMIGPAISNIIAFTIYNGIRYGFLWKKFRMQPFTVHTLYTLIAVAVCFLITYYLFSDKTGIEWIILRSTVFSVLFVTAVISLKLTPDLRPVLSTIKKRFRP